MWGSKRKLIQPETHVSVAPGYFNDKSNKNRYKGTVASKLGSSLNVTWNGEGGISSIVESDDFVVEPAEFATSLSTLIKEVSSVTSKQGTSYLLDFLNF